MNSGSPNEGSDFGSRSVDFRLEVQMQLQYLTAVRRTVCDMAQAVVHDADLASRLALTTHELLENALKYASDEHRPVTLKLWVDSSGRAQVVVENGSSPALFQSLSEYLRELTIAKDPVENYHRLVAESLHRSTGSGLGLARILAEAEMSLSCELNPSMVLTVRADVGGAR